MEPPPRRKRRYDDDIDDSSEQGEESPTQLGGLQESNTFHGTGIQSGGKFTVGGNLHINVNTFQKQMEEIHTTHRKRLKEHRPPIVWEQQHEENRRARKRLLKSLAFAQMDAREFAIQKAHTATCQWILTNRCYNRWVRRRQDMSSDRFVWLKGKPGAGKSTIMKFLLEHIQGQMIASRSNEILISFFLNARGTELEKSTLGLYRSLLLQLFRKRAEVQEVLDGLLPTHQWTEDSLKSVLERAVLQLQGTVVICMIDAIDECGTYQARNMVNFFNSLTQNYNHIYVCFASRHYPHISIVESLEIILEHQPEHHNDIKRYLKNTLRIGSGQLANEICSGILAKASGVFMWVVYVVDILNREFDAGRKHTLQKRLEELPQDLHTLFHDMLIRDTEDTGGLLLCIQWILFAERPLTPKELYFAIISGLEPECLRTCHVEDISADDIRKYILDKSKGLAEPFGTRKATVQFIHESVVDFLLKDNWLSTILSGLGGGIKGNSHNSLKICCLRYIEFLDSVDGQQQSDTQTIHDFPFKKYADEKFVFHADQAEEGGINQEDFMSDFIKGKWKRPLGEASRSSSPLYMLAKKRAGFLIRAYPTDQSCFTIDPAQCAMPIMEVVAAGMTETALALLEMEARTVPSLSFRSLCNAVAQPGLVDMVPARDYSFRREVGTFAQLARLAPELVTIVFLRTTEIDVNTPDRGGLTPLFHAISRHHLILLEHLIDLGADLSLCDREGRLPTHWAAQYGNVGAFAILDKHGCKIDARDKGGMAPLHHAVYRDFETIKLSTGGGIIVDLDDLEGHTPFDHAANPRLSIDTLERLVRDGAVIDARDKAGRTALHYAIWDTDLTNAEKLLSNGADASAVDDKGLTPLIYAFRHHCSQPDILSQAILLLQSYGVDVSDVDRRGETLLHWSLGRGLHECVVLLVDCGADISKPNRDGQTPIWSAVQASPPDVKTIRFLIDHGANIRDRDQDEYTLLHRAVERAKLDVVKVLVRNGASTTTRNKHGQSPLDLALSLGYVHISRYLLVQSTEISTIRYVAAI